MMATTNTDPSVSLAACDTRGGGTSHNGVCVAYMFGLYSQVNMTSKERMMPMTKAESTGQALHDRTCI